MHLAEELSFRGLFLVAKSCLTLISETVASRLLLIAQLVKNPPVMQETPV